MFHLHRHFHIFTPLGILASVLFWAFLLNLAIAAVFGFLPKPMQEILRRWRGRLASVSFVAAGVIVSSLLLFSAAPQANQNNWLMNLVTGQSVIGGPLGTTASTIYVTGFCGQQAACSSVTDESVAIQAAVTKSGCAVSGGCHIVDDMCGIQTWSVQPFNGSGSNTLAGLFEIRSNCPATNPHIISVDGTSTILVPSGLWVVGMGTSQGGRSPQYSSGGVLLNGGSYIRACNPAVYPCVNGGFVIQSGTVTSTGTLTANLSLVTMTGAPFTASSVNTLNTLQQYRMVHIVGSGTPTNNAAWVINDVVQSTSPQEFHIAAPTGFAACASSCGTAYLDTPLMVIGSGAGSGAFGSRIQNLVLDCSFMPGCGSWVQAIGQEQTGITDVSAWNDTVYGGRVDESCAYNGAGNCAGSTNSGDYGPWSSNEQSISCGKTTCSCMGGSGNQVTISSFTGTTGTLTFSSANNGLTAGTSVLLGGFTAGNVGLNTQVVTVLAAGLTNSVFEAAVTGSGYASGAGYWVGGPNACSSFVNGTPGTVVFGSTMSCGAGSNNATIATASGFDPCTNGNFQGFLFTGTNGSQGSGRVKGHTTCTIADKSNPGLPTPELWGGTTAGNVWGQGGVTGTPGTFSSCVGVYGTHGMMDHLHTEYFSTGLSVGGDANRTATFYYVYTAPAASPQARTGGFSVDGGFGSVCGSGTSCSPLNSIEIDIGSAPADANMIGDIDIRNMDVLNGNSGKALVDNVYGRSCITYGAAPGSDWVLSYKVGHTSTAAQTNAGETGIALPQINTTCSSMPSYTGNAFAVPLIATSALASYGIPVKIDTGTANQVKPTVTTDSAVPYVVVGVSYMSAAAGGYTSTVTTGVVPMIFDTAGTGTCAIGNIVVVGTATAGHVQCVTTPPTITACSTAYVAGCPGSIIGNAMQAENTTGGTFNVLVGPR